MAIDGSLSSSLRQAWEYSHTVRLGFQWDGGFTGAQRTASPQSNHITFVHCGTRCEIPPVFPLAKEGTQTPPLVKPVLSAEPVEGSKEGRLVRLGSPQVPREGIFAD